MEPRANLSRRGRLAFVAAALVALVGCTAGPALAASAPSTSHRGHLVALLVVDKPSSAIPPPTYSKRCERTAKSQAALDRCAASQVTQLDRELTRALSVEGAYFGHSGVARTESKWVAFMKSECSLETRPYSGGSIRPVVYGDCERGLLVSRIAEIRSVLNSLPK
ncbi:MAG: lysozyme inhibitor LprI family protein [Acidimicrobiales bacterium]